MIGTIFEELIRNFNEALNENRGTSPRVTVALLMVNESKSSHNGSEY